MQEENYGSRNLLNFLKKLTGTLHAGRMLTYVTTGLQLIRKGKRILTLPVQENQHFSAVFGCCVEDLHREKSGVSKGPGYHKMVLKMNTSFQSAAIISSSNSDQPKEEKQRSIGKDKLRLARRPPAELSLRTSHHKPTRRATSIS